MAIKQRFLYFFAGDALDTDVWSTRYISGSGTIVMADSINGGLEVSTSTTSDAIANIALNNIRQYSPTASTILGTVKRVTTSSVEMTAGMLDDEANPTTSHTSALRDNPSNTWKELLTNNGTGSVTVSSIASDTNWTNYKIVLGSSDHKLTLNGVLEVTKTTNIPSNKMQPHFQSITKTTASATCAILNCEAFNT